MAVTVGGGAPPPPPPPLPMFEADSQISASVPSVPRGFRLQNLWSPYGPHFWPAFGGDHRGTIGGGGSQPTPPLPLVLDPCHESAFLGRGVLEKGVEQPRSPVMNPPRYSS